MKIIALEEHYGLPVIHDAALKANDPYTEVLEAKRKSGPLSPWHPIKHDKTLFSGYRQSISGSIPSKIIRC
jgi:hypothetical protein